MVGLTKCFHGIVSQYLTGEDLVAVIETSPIPGEGLCRRAARALEYSQFNLRVKDLQAGCYLRCNLLRPMLPSVRLREFEEPFWFTSLARYQNFSLLPRASCSSTHSGWISKTL